MDQTVRLSDLVFGGFTLKKPPTTEAELLCQTLNNQNNV